MLAKHFPWCAGFEEDIRRLFEGYVEAKQSQHVLDYDDLLLYWAELMKVPEVASEVCGLFDHVLVDEYQDTNAIQAAIFWRSSWMAKGSRLLAMMPSRSTASAPPQSATFSIFRKVGMHFTHPAAMDSMGA